MSRHRRRKPIPNTPVDVHITGLTHDGRGIARHEDKILFVMGALPGETVRAKYNRCFSRYDEATAIEVLADPSADRAQAPCDYFGLCGGCQLQHMQPQAQIN